MRLAGEERGIPFDYIEKEAKPTRLEVRELVVYRDCYYF
jgi:hypothetical protein